MKLFIENTKGIMTTYEHIERIKIHKIDNKNTLQVEYKFSPIIENILLSKIKLCYLLDEKTQFEVFRYKK